MIIRKDFIPLLKGIDLTTRRLPFMVADSQKPGPVLWLTAAVHGDEVTGTAIIQSLFKRFETQQLSAGSVYAFPILNPSGFETISRSDVYTAADINRHFNGDDKGTTAERLAAVILSTILATKPNYLIDLHSDSTNSIPYTIIDYPKMVTDLEHIKKNIRLAETLGFAWAIDTDKTAGYPQENCLTGRLNVEGVPAITVEIGAPWFVIDQYRKLGLESIWSLLAALSMIEGPKQSLKPVPEVAHRIGERIITQSTGIIDFRVAPGEQIKKEKVLGKIRNVFGETIEVIRSPLDGFLLSHEDQSVTFPGQTLFTIAEETTLTDIWMHTYTH